MFRPLGAEDIKKELEEKQKEKELKREIETLKRENEELKKQITLLVAQQQNLLKEREKQAYEEGFRKGKEESYLSFANTLKKVLQELETLKKKEENELHRIKELVIQLVMGVVYKLLPVIRNESLEAVLASIREIISSHLILPEGVKTVFLNPQDYKSMKNLLEEDHELQKLVDKFQLFFEPDPSLQPGDVVINSEAVDIEAQLETKLKEIENYLQENLNV
jgi:flagellar biosynthesis/type III secretory pathway protein FliH